MFKGLTDLGAIMRQAQEIGGRMQDMSSQLKTKRVTGSAGGGMVQVEANGLGEILKLEIDPQLVERGERDIIEDLVPAAVNQALRNARETHAELMKSMTDGVDLPGLDTMLAKIAGQPNQDT